MLSTLQSEVDTIKHGADRRIEHSNELNSRQLDLLGCQNGELQKEIQQFAIVGDFSLDFSLTRQINTVK